MFIKPQRLITVPALSVGSLLVVCKKSVDEIDLKHQTSSKRTRFSSTTTATTGDDRGRPRILLTSRHLIEPNETLRDSSPASRLSTDGFDVFLPLFLD